MRPPGSEAAPTVASGQGFQEQGEADTRDCAQPEAWRKRRAALAARAALLGLALHELHDGACLLVGEDGQRCAMPSMQAAEALVYGCEHVRAEVSALLGKLVPSNGVRHV